MADNATLNSGSGGKTVASASLTFSGDTAEVQIVGPALLSGSEGSWTLNLPAANSGVLSAAVQRVCIATDDVNLAAIKTSVELIDNAVSGSEMQVDVVAALPAGTNNIGDVDVLTLPAITIAAAQTLATVTTVGAVTSITNALPAGSNAIGKLAANSGVDIGDVDVTSVIPGTGVTNLGKTVNDVAGASDVGVAALVVRDDELSTLTPADGDYVRLRVDAEGALWVNGSNYNQPISATSLPLPSGAATAAKQPALGTAGTASTDVITIQGIASGTVVPVSDGGGALTVDGTVTANAGTNLNTSALALESGGNLAAAATSLAIIDDWDESDRAKVNPIVGQAGVAAGAGAVGATVQRTTLASDDPAVVDLAAIEAIIIGTLRGAATPVIDSYNTITISAAANTANQALVSAPGANKQIWIYGLTGTADTGDGSIALQDEDDTTITGVMEISRRGGFVINPSGNFAMPWKKMVTNKALEIDTVTCGFKGILQYAVVSV